MKNNLQVIKSKPNNCFNTYCKSGEFKKERLLIGNKEFESFRNFFPGNYKLSNDQIRELLYIKEEETITNIEAQI